jgi:hypothetical protein
MARTELSSLQWEKRDLTARTLWWVEVMTKQGPLHLHVLIFKLSGVASLNSDSRFSSPPENVGNVFILKISNDLFKNSTASDNK